MRTILTFGFLLALTASAVAHTFSQEDFVCPLCTNRFSTFMDASGTQMGMRLDFKPLGPIAAPWSVAVCPRCRFVLYQGARGTYTKAEVKDLKAFVASPSYAGLPTNAPSYQRLALIREHLKQPSADIGWAWLQASWQVESGQNSGLCHQCLTNSARAFDAALAVAKAGDKAYITAALLRGELHRRLGEMKQAREWFQHLQVEPAFKTNYFPRLIRQQLSLIATGNTAPQNLESSRDEK